MLFKRISKDEFERLSLEERMNYLQRLMDDLRGKLEETRAQAERIRRQGAEE
jgi:hypothetical protein